jgi:hypothetical protein
MKRSRQNKQRINYRSRRVKNQKGGIDDDSMFYRHFIKLGYTPAEINTIHEYSACHQYYSDIGRDGNIHCDDIPIPRERDEEQYDY